MNFRTPGQVVFPANFERMVASPLDASQLVQTYSALTQPDTFKSIVDGNNYAYKGMFTVVVNDEDSYKNGIYYLKELPSIDPENWEHVSTSTDVSYISGVLDKAYSELDTRITNTQESSLTELSNVSSLLNDDISSVNNSLLLSANTLTNIVTDTTITLTDHINNVEYKTTQNIQSSNQSLNDKIDSSNTTLSNIIDSSVNKLNNSIQSSNQSLNDKIDIIESNTNQNIIDLNSSILSSSQSLNDKIDSSNTTLSNIINNSVDQLNQNIQSSNQSLNDKIDIIESNTNQSIVELNNSIQSNSQNLSSDLLKLESTTNQNIIDLNSSILSSSQSLNDKIDSSNTTLSNIIDSSVNKLNNSIQSNSQNLSSDLLKLESNTNQSIVELNNSIQSNSQNLSGEIQKINTSLQQNISTVNNTLSSQISDVSIDGKSTSSILQNNIQTINNELSTTNKFIVDTTHYTNDEPTTISVGGIEAGSTFDGVHITQILQDLLYKEVYPTIIEPSVSLNIVSGISNNIEYVEMGVDKQFTLQANFNPGSITPVYANNGKRILDKANWSGDVYEIDTYITTNSNNVINITASTQSPQYLMHFNTLPSWFGKKDYYTQYKYNAGKYGCYSSKGTLQKLPSAGITNTSNKISIIYTLPYYATTSSIDVVHKANSNVNYNTSYLEFDLVDETITEKQTLLLPTIWLGNKYTFQQFDTSSSTWKELTNGFIIKNDTIINWNNKNISSLDGKLNKNIIGNIPILTSTPYTCIMWDSDTAGARKVRIFK